jgi:class 3 adenylate cyclase
MVAGGLPIATPRLVHGTAIAEMALDMIDAVQSYVSRHTIPISVRIGFHTGGSVVAGVIGLKKFSYDVRNTPLFSCSCVHVLRVSSGLG